MYDHVWSCMNIYDHLWSFMIIYDQLSIYDTSPSEKVWAVNWNSVPSEEVFAGYSMV